MTELKDGVTEQKDRRGKMRKKKQLRIKQSKGGIWK